MKQLLHKTITEALLAAPPEKQFITMWHGADLVDEITFGDFGQASYRRALELTAMGVTPRDRVILVMPQSVALMVSFAGAVLAGAVPTILAYPNFKIEPEKYRSGLTGVSKNLAARLIVTDESFPDELSNCIETDDSPPVMRVKNAHARETSGPVTPYFSAPDDTAFIQHSAGTTGLQKGVALSHRAILAQLSHLAAGIELSESDRIYSWLPLYHDMGLIACFILPMVFHLPVVMQSPTSWVLQPATMLSLISDYNCTLSWVPNFALQFLSRRVPEEFRRKVNLSSLRMLVNCSEPVRAKSIDEFAVTFKESGFRPAALQASYAMAENVFAVTTTAPTKQPRRVWINPKLMAGTGVVELVAQEDPTAACFVSSGICLMESHIRILSKEKISLGEGHCGEIAIKSDCLFDGYFNRPDLTSGVLQDGWYFSGDIGFCVGGELFVVGRISDLIIVNGKNVYPQDIEEIVCRHPGIHDGRAIAIGVFNDELGSEEIIVIAEYENEERIPESDSIEQFIRSTIAIELGVAIRSVFLRPPRWIVKSTAGKPARSATRAKLAGEVGSLLYPLTGPQQPLTP